MSSNILSNLVINRVRSVSSMYSPEGMKMRRNDRQCWAIIIKYEGETVYTSADKQIVSDINRAVILPRGCSYDWECTKSGHFYSIEFESDQTHFELLSFPMKHGEKILRLFSELEYKRNLRGAMFEAESIRDA